MGRKLIIMLLSLLIIMPAYTQENETGDKKEEKAADKNEAGKNETGGQVYSEITLEDFESTVYNDSNLVYRVTGDQKGGLMIRDQYPSPAKDSKKYLGVKIFGGSGDVISIIPPKRLIINKHCRSISIWAYGKGFSGELSLLLRDSADIAHRLVFGKLNFSGWKKLTVLISDEVAQQDKYLNQKKDLEILKILYNPGNTSRMLIWNYFYLDDITAAAREKYTDKQSDEW
jgi:hypothetical protein